MVRTLGDYFHVKCSMSSSSAKMQIISIIQGSENEYNYLHSTSYWLLFIFPAFLLPLPLLFLPFLLGFPVFRHAHTHKHIHLTFKVKGMGLRENGGVRVRTLCYIIDAPYYLTSWRPWLCYKQSLLINYSLDDFEQKNDSADQELALALRLSAPGVWLHSCE